MISYYYVSTDECLYFDDAVIILTFYKFTEVKIKCENDCQPLFLGGCELGRCQVNIAENITWKTECNISGNVCCTERKSRTLSKTLL